MVMLDAEIWRCFWTECENDRGEDADVAEAGEAETGERCCRLVLLLDADEVLRLGTYVDAERVAERLTEASPRFITAVLLSSKEKGADLLVVNEVGESAGFEVAHNAAVVLGADGSSDEIPATTKDLLAHRVWDLVAERLPRS